MSKKLVWIIIIIVMLLMLADSTRTKSGREEYYDEMVSGSVF